MDKEMYRKIYTYNDMEYTVVDTLQVHESIKNDPDFFNLYISEKFMSSEVIDEGINISNDDNIPRDARRNVEEDNNNKMWNERNTRLLVQLYQERKERFCDPRIKKKKLWIEISNEMHKHGYNISDDDLDKKFRNMKKTYKTIKQNKNSTGRGRITWRYYDIFEEIFINDRTINCGPTISSMNQSRSSTFTVTSSMTSTLTVTPQADSNSPSCSHNRTSSPPARRYARHTSPTRKPRFDITHISTFSPHFCNLSFSANSLFNENIINSFVSSSSSSSVTGSDYSFDSSTDRISSRRQRKNKCNKEKYYQRNKLIAIEQQRVKEIAELKQVMKENNAIQQKRNDILMEMNKNNQCL